MTSPSWQKRFGLPSGAAQALGTALAALDNPQETVQALERLLERGAETEGWLPKTPGAATALARLAYAAPFLVRFLTGHSERLGQGVLEGLEGEGAKGAGLLPWPGAALDGPALGEGELVRGLRLWKYDNYVRLTARALLGAHPPATTCRGLSDLADGMIAVAYRFAFAQQALRLGMPHTAEGGAGLGAVLGMGKLGGRELNYSSDVDLIFFHGADDGPCAPLPEGATPPSLAEPDEAAYWAGWAGLARAAGPGAPGAGRRRAGGGEFHNQVARQVVRLLSENTAEGFGFRVDTDLRPMGRSGMLAPSLAFLAQYYEAQGREWERTAMLKARLVAGHPGTGHELWQVLRPFVFRRYLDYSAVEGVAIVKHDIDRAERQAPGDNLKLGAGGIRENEFFIQALQLLYGGKNPQLQVPGHAEAVARLTEAGLLAPAEGEAHLAAYWLMRGLENRLQMVEEAQTHDLPSEPDARRRVFHDFEPGFEHRRAGAEAALAEARRGTGERFHRLFAGMDAADFPDPGAWQENLRAQLAPGAAEEALGRINALLGRLMDTREGERCVFKVGRLLNDPEIYRTGAEPALPRWLDFLEQIGNRNALHTLIAANPEIVPRVTTLFADGGIHTRLLLRHPEFLDSYLALSHKTPEGFRQTFARIVDAAADEEEFILELRMGKSQALLQILTAYLDAPPDGRHRGQLSELAEATVAACTAFAWRQVCRRFGFPEGAGEGPEPKGFAVMGLGKLGSREMHFGSDLDLGFVYRGKGTTTGGKSHFEFFTKLAQRISTLLTSQTQFGNLYEIDHRLRPFGAKGMLVPSLSGLADFMRSAEVWNFQAFTRLRFLCGDAALGADMVGSVAAAWRGAERNLPAVARAVWEMLGRLVAENDPARHGAAGAIPLKYAVGGLIGFEFLSQFFFLEGQLEGGPQGALRWTPPAPHETIARLRPSYRALAGLDERLSFYEERFQHRATPELFARLPSLDEAWGMEAVGRLCGELEAGVRDAFAEQMG